MRGTKRTVYAVLGGLLLLGSAFVAYGWFYLLAPLRHLTDPAWTARHSERVRWLEEQRNYHRLGCSPDLCFRADRIGYYGDKKWCHGLIGKISGKTKFRFCGCTETVLMYMTNGHPQSWENWAKIHGGQSQEEWLRDGFASFGVTVHLPPAAADIEPLLGLLGRRQVDLLWKGPQPVAQTPDTAVPDYAQYNAFRWLRDSGFEPARFLSGHSKALLSEETIRGLVNYANWQGRFPRCNGLGILAFGARPAGAAQDLDPPSRLGSPWLVAAVYAVMVALGIAGGVLIGASRVKAAGLKKNRNPAPSAEHEQHEQQEQH